VRTRTGGWWWFAAFGVVFTASLLGAVRQAAACSPPPAGWFPGGIAPAPANGVLLLHYVCVTSCETLPNVGSLVLKSAAGEVVPGSVVFSQARATDLDIAFLPEPGAVTAGGSYTAELEGVSTTTGILMGPPVTWNDALSPSAEVFEVDYPAGEVQCCTDPVDTCGNFPCFREQVERRTAVTVGWYDDASIEQYQYVFRLGRDVIDPAAPWLWDSGDARFELEPGEVTGCYSLELKRLADDSVQTFASRCVEQPATFTPGLHTIPDEDVEGVLQACNEPPDGYEQAWCDAREPLCELSPDEPWCADLAARCAMSGAGGEGGASGAGSGEGANGGDTAGDGGTAGGGATAGGSGTAGGGGTAGMVGGMGGRAGSSGAQTGTGGGTATAGTTSTSSGAGGTAEAGAPDGEAGDASQSKTVLTEGCGCTVPGNRRREPVLLAVAIALLAFAGRRRRARNTL
jgi:MYXO-CTERM domain-containing protein